MCCASFAFASLFHFDTHIAKDPSSQVYKSFLRVSEMAHWLFVLVFYIRKGINANSNTVFINFFLFFYVIMVSVLRKVDSSVMEKVA